MCVAVACFLVSACFCAICFDLFTTSFVAWASDSTMVTGSPHLPGAVRHAMFGGSGGAALTCVWIWLYGSYRCLGWYCGVC